MLLSRCNRQNNRKTTVLPGTIAEVWATVTVSPASSSHLCTAQQCPTGAFQIFLTIQQTPQSVHVKWKFLFWRRMFFKKKKQLFHLWSHLHPQGKPASNHTDTTLVALAYFSVRIRNSCGSTLMKKWNLASVTDHDECLGLAIWISSAMMCIKYEWKSLLCHWVMLQHAHSDSWK